ncbi:hypothetical protein ACIQFZ_42075 [Streptomyces sp. NPDC093064]
MASTPRKKKQSDLPASSWPSWAHIRSGMRRELLDRGTSWNGG